MHGTKPRVFPTNFSLLQSPLALTDPIAIEALPDGTVLILDFDPLQQILTDLSLPIRNNSTTRFRPKSILKLIEESRRTSSALLDTILLLCRARELAR